MKRLPLFIPGVWSYADDFIFATLFFTTLGSWLFAFRIFMLSLPMAFAFDVLAAVNGGLLMLHVFQVNGWLKK